MIRKLALGLAAVTIPLGLASPALASDPLMKHVAQQITYVDAQMRPSAKHTGGERPAPYGRENPILQKMAQAAQRYEQEWGGLPAIRIENGGTLRLGSRGERVAQLRERLGLAPGDLFDTATKHAVRRYRAAHGLTEGTKVDREMIASLNRGPAYYSRLIKLNLARVAALPADLGGRFIFVDAAEQKLYMYEDDRIEKSMRVIVGKESDPTPMMVGLVRYAVLNPYWNIPPDLVRRNVAPKVLDEGRAYWNRADFEALSDWTDQARVLDFEEIDWPAVAAGDVELRVRQKPGPLNGMGQIKFMFPNRHGVYLHDTPGRALFDEDDRRFSAGCVRLEDAWELAEWLFGSRPDRKRTGPEEELPLDEPVPVYITYLTAVPNSYGFDFREDFYGRDGAMLAAR